MTVLFIWCCSHVPVVSECLDATVRRQLAVAFKWLKSEKIEQTLELLCPLNLELSLRIHR